MRLQGLARVGDKYACYVVADRNPAPRFIQGVGDTKEAALADLVENLCDAAGIGEHAWEPAK